MSPRAKVQAGGILRKSIDGTWRTPDYILDRARDYFGGPIPFDPATGPENPTKALRFCAGPAGTLFAGDSLESKNGLEVAWDWPTWVNPPFSREWTVKIGFEALRGAEIIALLPCNRFETDYWQEMFEFASVVCFHKGRVKFISSVDCVAVEGNPYASMILGFNMTGARLLRFCEAFKPLGIVKRLGAA